MEILLTFLLSGLNLYFAKIVKDNDGNPAFQYFAAGYIFSCGFVELLNKIL
jgi:hypothetical protein